MINKPCKKCDETKPLEAFYKHPCAPDGRAGLCKECAKASSRANRVARLDYYREYDRKRFQEDPRVKERHKRYQQTERGKNAMLRSRKKWVEDNPEKRAAHIALGNAVRDGRVEKPSRCSQCSKRHRRIHAHHHDYSKPFDVTWLCPQCHHAVHAEEII